MNKIWIVIDGVVEIRKWNGSEIDNLCGDPDPDVEWLGTAVISRKSRSETPEFDENDL